MWILFRCTVLEFRLLKEVESRLDRQKCKTFGTNIKSVSKFVVFISSGNIREKPKFSIFYFVVTRLFFFVFEQLHFYVKKKLMRNAVLLLPF